MPRVSTELDSQYWEPTALGPVAQADLTAAAGAPGQIAANGTFATGALYADGYKVIAVGVTLANAGTITIQRYIDAAGTVPQGPALTQALTANAPGVLNVGDGAPFQSFSVTISNSGASPAAVSAFALLLNAA